MGCPGASLLRLKGYVLWSLRSDGHIFCAWEPRLWKLWDGEMFRDIGHGIV
jgi:hypothetical protein